MNVYKETEYQTEGEEKESTDCQHLVHFSADFNIHSMPWPIMKQ